MKHMFKACFAGRNLKDCILQFHVSDFELAVFSNGVKQTNIGVIGKAHDSLRVNFNPFFLLKSEVVVFFGDLVDMNLP